MNIFEIGVGRGEEVGEKRGIEKGTAQNLVRNIDSAMKNLGINHPLKNMGMQRKCFRKVIYRVMATLEYFKLIRCISRHNLQ